MNLLKKQSRWAFLLMLLALCCCFSACTGQSNAKETTTETVNVNSPKDNYGEAAYAQVEYFQENLPKRVAGTEAETKAATYIQQELKTIGITDVTVQPFTFGENEKSQNICATLKGSSEKTIVIGAHYDSVKTHGVDDNASGVAVALETAERLKEKELPYTLKFVFFGAEEKGLYGSQSFVKSLENKEDIAFMVNIDSVLAGDKPYIYGGAAQDDGTVTDTWVVEQTQEMAKALGLKVYLNPGKNKSYIAPSTGDWSDHVAFKNAGIPFVYFEATNWDIKPYDGTKESEKLGEIMHSKNDDLEVINKNLEGRAVSNLGTYTTLLEKLLQEVTIPS